MKKRVILICEEECCPEASLEKVSEMNRDGEVGEVNCLKVISHPPMQWCEHGGADSEPAEHALDSANRKKREAWTAHEESIHGEKLKGVVDRLKGEGIGEVKIKFVQEEITLGNSIINELIDGSYDTAVITERIWDKMNGKKVPSETKVITVRNKL